MQKEEIKEKKKMQKNKWKQMREKKSN
jgi:hypothetical protein